MKILIQSNLLFFLGSAKERTRRKKTARKVLTNSKVRSTFGCLISSRESTLFYEVATKSVIRNSAYKHEYKPYL